MNSTITFKSLESSQNKFIYESLSSKTIKKNSLLETKLTATEQITYLGTRDLKWYS